MYEQFFGLDDEPFRLTPDPRYLYLSAKHAEALAHLKLGLSDSSGFVCITGEVGAGKTTLVRAFLADLALTVDAAYACLPPLSPVDLLRRICRELGLPAGGTDAGDLIEDLHAHLSSVHRQGRLAVLVLDEAQGLPIALLEQIRLLLNLETDTHKLLRIVLLGQPQLRRVLLDPALAQLNQRITLRWHLGPLSRAETSAYVDHRIRVASGGRVRSPFTRPAVRLLHSRAGGVPRLINMIGHRALLAAYVAGQARVTRGCVARAHRELQSVPLPGTVAPGRLVAWGAAGLTIGILLVALATAPLGRLIEHVRAADVAEASPGGGRNDPAAVVPTVAAVPAVAPEPPRLPAVALAAQLAAIAPDVNVRTAVDAVLDLWGERRLEAAEDPTPQGFEAVAWRRGLQHVVMVGNRSMLQLLDVPALLEVDLPAAGGTRYAALVGASGGDVILAVDGTATPRSAAELDRIWSGRAYVFWRDFATLGPVLSRGARGVEVVRLQKLLQGAGVLDGVPSGAFDDRTDEAVRRFQRLHRLDADGVVGPLTRIVLYRSIGGYAQPSIGALARAG